MDAAGAESLRWRIEQQQHWRLAAAVRDGRQPAVDPDSDELEYLDDGIRVYAARVTHGETVRFCKRLVGGVWEDGLLHEGDASADQAVPHEQIARVA